MRASETNMKWKIETTCQLNKKVVFECNKDGIVKVLEQERDVNVSEMNQIYDMIRMMENSKYIKMECTRL